MPDQNNKFISFPQSHLPALARQAVTKYRAKFDPPTPDQLETLDLVEALNRLMDQAGSAQRLQTLLVFTAATRGEAL